MAPTHEELIHWQVLQLGLNPDFDDAAPLVFLEPTPPPAVGAGFVGEATLIEAAESLGVDVAGALVAWIAIDLHRLPGSSALVLYPDGEPTLVFPRRLLVEFGAEAAWIDDVPHVRYTADDALKALAIASAGVAASAGFEVDYDTDSRRMRIRVLHDFADPPPVRARPPLRATRAWGYSIGIVGTPAVGPLTLTLHSSSEVTWEVTEGTSASAALAGLHGALQASGLLATLQLTASVLGDRIVVRSHDAGSTFLDRRLIAAGPGLSLSLLCDYLITVVDGAIPSVHGEATLEIESGPTVAVSLVSSTTTSTSAEVLSEARDLLTSQLDSDSTYSIAIEGDHVVLRPNSLVRDNDGDILDGYGAFALDTPTSNYLVSLAEPVADEVAYAVLLEAVEIASFVASETDDALSVCTALVSQLNGHFTAESIELFASLDNEAAEPRVAIVASAAASAPVSGLAFSTTLAGHRSSNLRVRVQPDATSLPNPSIGPHGHFGLAVDGVWCDVVVPVTSADSYVEILTSSESDSLVSKVAMACDGFAVAGGFAEGIVLASHDGEHEIVAQARSPDLCAIRVLRSSNDRYVVRIGEFEASLHGNEEMYSAEDIASVLADQLKSAVAGVPDGPQVESEDEFVFVQLPSGSDLDILLAGPLLVDAPSGRSDESEDPDFQIQIGPFRLSTSTATDPEHARRSTYGHLGRVTLDLQRHPESNEALYGLSLPETKGKRSVYVGPGLAAVPEAREVKLRIWGLPQNSLQWRVLEEFGEMSTTGNTMRRIPVAGLARIYTQVVRCDGLVRVTVAPCR